MKSLAYLFIYILIPKFCAACFAPNSSLPIPFSLELSSWGSERNQSWLRLTLLLPCRPCLLLIFQDSSGVSGDCVEAELMWGWNECPRAKAVCLPPSLQAESRGIKVEEIWGVRMKTQQLCAPCAWRLSPGWEAKLSLRISCSPLQNESSRARRLKVIKMAWGFFVFFSKFRGAGSYSRWLSWKAACVSEECCSSSVTASAVAMAQPASCSGTGGVTGRGGRWGQGTRRMSAFLIDGNQKGSQERCLLGKTSSTSCLSLAQASNVWGCLWRGLLWVTVTQVQKELNWCRVTWSPAQGFTSLAIGCYPDFWLLEVTVAPLVSIRAISRDSTSQGWLCA